MGQPGLISLITLLIALSPMAWSAQKLRVSPEVSAPIPAIKALSFKKWKDEQVTEAQNQVVRLSNSIHLLESKKYRPTDQELAGRDKAELLDAREQELDKALQQLQFTKELDMEDYYAVYLRQFSDDPEALKKLAKKLSADEMAELLQILLKSKKTTRIQSLNPAGLVTGLSQGDAAKASF